MIRLYESRHHAARVHLSSSLRAICCDDGMLCRWDIEVHTELREGMGWLAVGKVTVENDMPVFEGHSLCAGELELIAAFCRALESGQFERVRLLGN